MPHPYGCQIGPFRQLFYARRRGADVFESLRPKTDVSDLIFVFGPNVGASVRLRVATTFSLRCADFVDIDMTDRHH